MATHPSLELLTRDRSPNYTIPTELCTLQTCSIVLQSQLSYDPDLAGNVFFTALFGLLLTIQLFLGLYYRTWTYAIGTVCGLALELCGYIGRIQMHFNPFIQSPFFMSIPHPFSHHPQLIRNQVSHIPHHRPHLPLRIHLHMLLAHHLCIRH